MHDGYWGLKSILVLVLWVVFMKYVPTDTFILLYLQGTRILSLLFLMYQASMMVAVAYEANQLVRNFGSDGVMVAITIVIFIGNIVWTIF